MPTNISIDNSSTEEQVSKLLSLIGQPARIQILVVISNQDACVCHLETVLGMRQASISQHLMVLRKADLVTAHRDGRNIYYHLAHPEVIEILQQAVLLTGSHPDILRPLMLRPVSGCSCPQCCPDADPKRICRSMRSGSKQILAG